MVALAVLVLGTVLQDTVPFSATQVSGPTTIMKQPANDNQAPRLSPQRRQHILYGDEKGGGHHHSANKPCKSEFPEDWDEDRIIETVTKMAANDNIPWRQEDNGYHVSEQSEDGLDIRVILDREGDDIVTAYPLNVPRNPCDN
ncbi:MAG: EndoU domain-containing protein [Rhodospirillales bacterium]|nr:EndoU domain-containing protein [Rhodospirillales bacterium]MCB9995744.1 EndoU domain-containing protein [Rhodospirillales bacterium]